MWVEECTLQLQICHAEGLSQSCGLQATCQVAEKSPKQRKEEQLWCSTFKNVAVIPMKACIFCNNVAQQCSNMLMNFSDGYGRLFIAPQMLVHDGAQRFVLRCHYDFGHGVSSPCVKRIILFVHKTGNHYSPRLKKDSVDCRLLQGYDCIPSFAFPS